MNIIKFKPTSLVITETARKTIKAFHDNEALPYALEAIRKNQSINTPIKWNWLEKLRNSFNVKSDLKVIVGKSNEGDFFLTTSRKIGVLPPFVGNKVKLNMEEIAYNPKKIDEILLESKKGILEKISSYNENKRNLFKV